MLDLQLIFGPAGLRSNGCLYQLPLVHAAGVQGSVKPALLKLVRERSKAGSTIIVYTSFQAHAEELASYLYVNNVLASSYHAGKGDKVTPSLVCLRQSPRCTCTL